MSLKRRNIMLGRELRYLQPTQQLNSPPSSFHPSWTWTLTWRQRRKTSRRRRLPILIRCSNPFDSFLSEVASPLALTTAALALLYNKFNSNNNNNPSSSHREGGGEGEWCLFSSPTPFNRFVKLRCPSLLLPLKDQDLNDDDYDTGRIPPPPHHNDNDVDDVSSCLLLYEEYQRVCVNTEDGGVLSLDWPSNLELSLEDDTTTIVIIPGTTDGSMDPNVTSFVSQCLSSGCFPIVINPRGCARSPLTTPRLFTPADSDDISTALHFLTRARPPWTSFMAVGFGYGANILTKYLSHVGDQTPLTAASCLDNPFDLKAASASAASTHFHHNLTSGLIHILQSNKELFLGPSKRFDVERALQAKSLQDFQEAISMVSYGFDSIQEFYVSSSTTDVVANVKIPLLFIQNDAMPFVSTPRSLIAENPFTSLLTCTFQSSDKTTTGTSDVSWCRQLAVEWLTAVELGLLKGRHPLLENSDLSISPSKQMTSHASSRGNKFLNFHQLDGHSSHPRKKMLKTSDEYVNSSSVLDLPMSNNKEKDANNGMVTQTNFVDLKEGDVDSERGKVLQATEVAMNMLGVTMPEALAEEQKLKVLTAVSQGESLMNALQDAVPEDVRGKLTSSVTTILENQKKNLNGPSHVPDGASAAHSKMQEKPVGLSNVEKERNAPELNTSLTEEDSNNHPSNKNDASEPTHTLGNFDEGQDSSSGTTSNHDQLGSDEFSKEKSAQFHDSDSSDMSNISRKMEGAEDHTSDQVNLGLEGGTNVEMDNQHKDASEHTTDVSTPPRTEKTSTSSTEMAKQDNENQKTEESNARPVPSSNSPSFSVSEALDALTGMDDSTQVAVNSVFSVIEDVITQLEGNRDNGSAIDDNNTSTDSRSESAAPPQKGGDGKGGMTTELKEVGNHQQTMSISREKKDEANKNPEDIQNSITRIPYTNSLYDHYVQSHLYSKMKNEKLLQLDAAADLYLDYVPEEGQWKLLDQSGDNKNYVDDVPSLERTLPSDVECNDNIIEPTYVIFDADGDSDPVGEYKKPHLIKEKHEIRDVASVQLLQFVKENILKSLEVEISRRIPVTDIADIALVLKKELENVANTISLAIVHDKQHVISWDGEKVVGLGNLQHEHVLGIVSSAVQGTRYMKEVIPVGIVVGSCLASLRKIVNINAAESIGSTEAITDQISDSQEGYQLQADRMAADENLRDKVNQNNFYSEDEEKDVSSNLGRDTVMVGAVTAALGASALLVHQQNSYSNGLESSATSSMLPTQKENHREPGKLEETPKSGDSIVTSLAEKAMLVAGPVVPTNEDGGVDQDRLVALLADLGQRGGILKLVGKVALLWGGIRGAMSLIGKLISFLRLSERSLFQRILGFVFMVLVLWTPVVVPLLPTLVQNWTTHNSSKYAELACIIGLYSSIMILVVLWGKRIRGYEDPLERYGLEFTSARQIHNFIYGLVGGVMLVLLIQYTNVLLGFVCLSLPSIPSSADTYTLLKLFGKVARFVGHGFVTTVAIALVEELLFRSWLHEEIAVDLGYNQGVILSGLAFSLSQWSLKAIPGVWLLSVGLAGVRQRCQGKLSLPIGLRAGIMASSFVLKEGGFLIYQQHKSGTYPLWVSGGGGDLFQPFNGIVGLAVAFLWAAILYPRNSQNAQQPENIKE